jgi:hypothetical protein
MNSHLQSNGATQTAKVDTLIPSAIFHSFQTELAVKQTPQLKEDQIAAGK